MKNSIMRPNRVFLSRTFLLLLVFALAGCSALRLGYANGDTFVYWWLNSYVDFNNDQKPWVEQHIDRLFDWHRKTQLKEYAQLLGKVQQRVQRGHVTPAEVQADFTVVKKHAAHVLEKALPALTDLALSLQPSQLEHLEQKFASNNDKYRKESLTGSLEGRQRVRYKKVMKQAEYWLGSLSAEQEEKIRTASDARPLNNEIWLTERQRRQQEMLRMLRQIQAERPARDAATAMLRDYMTRSLEHFTYAQHKDFFDASNQGMAQMITIIVNTATPEQREHAVRRLQKWIEDCEALAAK